MNSTKTNPVTSPAHYRLFPDGTEAIDVIRATLTSAEFRGYCKGNFLKYRLRAGEKGGAEIDLSKSEVYRSWLNDEGKNDGHRFR